jgi:aspartyl/asparaginyl-tRNA synthetase
MERTLINQIQQKEGREALLEGKVLNVRSLGNIIFLVVQDYTGTIQVVFEKNVAVKMGEAIAIKGLVKKEPRAKGGYEIQGEKVEIISALTAELPFDLARNELNQYFA